MYFVYILKCKDGSLYTGISTDPERRFLEHKNKKGGHYTSSHVVEKIVYQEECISKSAALKREIQIKGWKRSKKLNLINFGHPTKFKKPR
ncbi:MAG: GIY-YIG nuclease family protein [bacterium]|nr:GIY-YIG nuclease family protein [bacterium]